MGEPDPRAHTHPPPGHIRLPPGDEGHDRGDEDDLRAIDRGCAGACARHGQAQPDGHPERHLRHRPRLSGIEK